MAPLKPRAPSVEERVSKSRVLNALLLTALSIVFIIVWGYHSVWAVKVMLNRTYGGFINNLIYGPGTFVVDVALGFRFITYLNFVLLDEKLDVDHKKYL
ncbi:hypothetical protein CAAN1_07S05050 [[Candida] anglica]|uniref:Uncharacterized protein n=1 Tax=[Candida] anglica TaxID=148631 RepID=A0ABP0EFR9_9ASCO